jgi:hypothetical protein
MRLIPKNWDKHQHYKDRSPPWIKLKRDLLNDRVFMCLPIASKALAPLMWLLASESKTGEFDASIEELCFRLRLTEDQVNQGLKPLIEKGFFIVASGVLADCQQVAIPETETETEGERDTETKREAKKETQDKPARFDPLAMELPNSVRPSAWEDWIKYRRSRKLTCSEPTMIAQLNNLDTWWNNGHDPAAIIQASISNGWQGLFEPKQTSAPAKPVMSNAEMAKIAMQRLKGIEHE